MIKIKSLFQRNYEGNRQVRNEVVPGSEWVTEGIGYATRKWDGMAVRLQAGVVYVRFDAKVGRTPPADFEPTQPHPDPETGHWPGWVKASGKILQRIEGAMCGNLPDGTYEFCGPSVGTRHGANPERLTAHVLVPHGQDVLEDCPRDFEGLQRYLAEQDMEGVVWYHPDGRLVKLKAADFGITRN